MRDWSIEDINFLNMYYNNSPIKEIADELGIPVNDVSLKAIELEIQEVIPDNHKKCSACKEIKHVNLFYKKFTAKDGFQCYYKECHDERKRNINFSKKLKEKSNKDTMRNKICEKAKLDSKNKIYVCVECGLHKLGKDFYFKSTTLKRCTRCISCYLKYRENLKIKK